MTDTEFEQQLLSHVSKLKKFCARLVGTAFNKHEDLTQETLRKAWRARDTYEEDKPLVHWLYRIATNNMHDLKRMERRRTRVCSFEDLNSAYGTDDYAFDHPSPFVGTEELEGNMLVMKVINDHFTPGTLKHNIMVDDIVHGMEYGELAEKYNKPVGTIRSTLYRCREVLRMEFAENVSKQREYALC